MWNFIRKICVGIFLDCYNIGATYKNGVLVSEWRNIAVLGVWFAVLSDRKVSAPYTLPVFHTPFQTSETT